jgi:hypothetical protein
MVNACEQNPFSAYCSAPTRKPSSWESTSAELFTFFTFMFDFKSRHPNGLVINNFFKNFQTGDPITDIVLKWLTSDFRNASAQASLKKAGATHNRLLGQDSLTGESRKPDVLGIAIESDRTLLELVEVTTVSQAASTIQEDIVDKLSILENQVKPHASQEISNANLLGMKSSGSANIEVKASEWRLPWQLMEMPLVTPQMFSAETNTAKFEWMCFKPTCRQDYPRGRDGLILYEIHSTGERAGVPLRVLRAVAQRAKQLGTSTELTLLPGLKNYWQDNAGDQRQLLAYVALGLGAAALLTLVVLLLPEEAVVGLSVLAGQGAVAVTEAALAGLSTAIRLVPQAISVAVRVFSTAGVSLSPALVL